MDTRADEYTCGSARGGAPRKAYAPVPPYYSFEIPNVNRFRQFSAVFCEKRAVSPHKMVRYGLFFFPPLTFPPFRAKTIGTKYISRKAIKFYSGKGNFPLWKSLCDGSMKTPEENTMNHNLKTCGRLLGRFLALILLCTVVLPFPAARAEEADGHQKLIAITFDDGPSDNTPVLLDGLEARGVVATFFMCGANGSHGVLKHKDLLYRMRALGCQMANHSWAHASFTKISGDQMVHDIEAVEEYLYDVAGGRYEEVVRIPGGSNTERIRANVRHPMIRWSIDPFDWRDRNEEIVYERLMNLAHDGGVILLHDLYPTSIAAGLRAIDSLRAQGYEFVTVSELFRRRGIYLENGVVYNSAPYEGVQYPAYTAPDIRLSAEPATNTAAVTLFSSEAGVSSIHYTLDGSTPTLASPLYEGAFSVPEGSTVRAAGFDRFATRTPIAEKEVHTVTAAPKIMDVSHGRMSLYSATEGATILYTTDGSDPRTDGKSYTSAFAPGKVTKAVAYVPGQARSNISTIVKLSDGSLFRDLDPEAWYYSAVDDVVKRGYMGSVGDYCFQPDGYLTRAAMVSILYRMEKSPAVSTTTEFEDVPADAWFAKAVAWASENGITYGNSWSTFDPTGVLSRQQGAVILSRYAEYSKRRGKSPGSLAAYADADQVSAYAESAVAWCAANGLLDGGMEEGVLAPKEPLLRKHCASMISVLRTIRGS